VERAKSTSPPATFPGGAQPALPAAYEGDGLDLYRVLRAVNLRLIVLCADSRRDACGSSPEPLVRVEDGSVLTRPLAARDSWSNRRGDGRLRAELLADEKERASM